MNGGLPETLTDCPVLILSDFSIVATMGFSLGFTVWVSVWVWKVIPETHVEKLVVK